METADIKDLVRARYGSIAAEATSCCAPAPASGGPADKARQMGYAEADLAAVPEGANLGLGCGNPGTIAPLKPGAVVEDYGVSATIEARKP